MNIIQARELVMQGKTVISPLGKELEWAHFDSTNFHISWSHDEVFGEWREKREPRRVYGIQRKDGTMSMYYYETNDLHLAPGEHIVEFVEVVK